MMTWKHFQDPKLSLESSENIKLNKVLELYSFEEYTLNRKPDMVIYDYTLLIL